ncbi:hypothetical protein F383_33630 [Gossypium arboreum]|uniref:Uncharacterized protein n=1 Tax=Gossypium arboreum TaxID=29729 RepID=A0A0B0PN03_GOSAR|nr:hypothetical protein F383_33630 [Gossypium arboreum]
MNPASKMDQSAFLERVIHPCKLKFNPAKGTRPCDTPV